ncbi:MAG TPA: hypothetical protein VJA47_03845 [archaeon]|nr:hypothetical protein [archaeon]
MIPDSKSALIDPNTKLEVHTILQEIAASIEPVNPDAKAVGKVPCRESKPDKAYLEPPTKNILVCYGRVRGFERVVETGYFERFDAVVYVLGDKRYYLFDTQAEERKFRYDPEAYRERFLKRQGRLRSFAEHRINKGDTPVLVLDDTPTILDEECLFDTSGKFIYGNYLFSGDSAGARIVGLYGEGSSFLERCRDRCDLLVANGMEPPNIGQKATVVFRDRGGFCEGDSIVLPRGRPGAVSIQIGESGNRVRYVTDNVMGYLKQGRVSDKVGFSLGKMFNRIDVDGVIQNKLGVREFVCTGPWDYTVREFVNFLGLDFDSLSRSQVSRAEGFLERSVAGIYGTQNIPELRREYNRSVELRISV